MYIIIILYSWLWFHKGFPAFQKRETSHDFGQIVFEFIDLQSSLFCTLFLDPKHSKGGWHPSYHRRLDHHFITAQLETFHHVSDPMDSLSWKYSTDRLASMSWNQICTKLDQIIDSYCWWLKSCTTWDVWNPINNGKNYLATGAGFQPSTVSQMRSIFKLRFQVATIFSNPWKGVYSLFVPITPCHMAPLKGSFPRTWISISLSVA